MALNVQQALVVQRASGDAMGKTFKDPVRAALLYPAQNFSLLVTEPVLWNVHISMVPDGSGVPEGSTSISVVHPFA